MITFLSILLAVPVAFAQSNCYSPSDCAPPQHCTSLDDGIIPGTCVPVPTVEVSSSSSSAASAIQPSPTVEVNSIEEPEVDFSYSSSGISPIEGVTVAEDEDDEPEYHGEGNPFADFIAGIGNGFVDGVEVIGIGIGKAAQSAGEAIVSGFCGIFGC